MFQVLLLTSLLSAAQAPAAASGQVPTIVDGTTLAQEGHYEAALEAFRRIAAANPRNHEARLWIGRLHNWMGHSEQAEPVFRSVLLEDPANVEAMIGLGTTLVELRRTEEGIDMLRRAEQAQPQNPELLADLGRAHVLAGHTTLGLAYAERAVTIAPTEAHRVMLEQARVVHDHRVEIRSFGERYNTTTADTGSVDVGLNYRLRENLRIIGRGQHQDKFGFSEQRGGGGFEWRFLPRTALFGQVLVGSPDSVVLPRVDVNGEISHTEGPSHWVAGYRFFDFGGANASVISPGVTIWPTERFSIGARYFLTVTDFATLSGTQNDHSGTVRGAYQLKPRINVSAAYARGTENFDTLSPDRLGSFAANTVSGGVRFDFPSLTSLNGVYEHQWRPQDIRMHRLSISLLQRF
jgi:YaiO family outer membrane protein